MAWAKDCDFHVTYMPLSDHSRSIFNETAAQGDAQGHEGEEGRGRRPQGDAPRHEGQVSGDTDERGSAPSFLCPRVRVGRALTRTAKCRPPVLGGSDCML